METEVKNRAWVKDAAIIFLAVLLVLTFFSQTILNASLTEVATQAVSSGAITAKVRGTGKVVANGSNKVKATGTVTIAKVMVKTGAEVKTGDVLFVLGAGDSAELETAKEKLYTLEASYNSALASSGVSSHAYDYTNLNSLKSKLDEAEKARDEAKLLWQAELTTPQEKIDKAYEALKAAETDLKAKQDASDEALKTLKKDVDDAYDTLKKLMEESADQEKIDAAAKAVVAAEEAVNERKDPAYLALKQASDTYNTAKNTYDSLTTTGTTASAQYATYLDAQTKYETALNNYNLQAASIQDSLYTEGQTYAAKQAELASLADQIERQEEKIKKLSGEGDDNVIEAKTNGTVTEINCSSGDTVVKDDILAVIEVPDMGYTVSFSVTNDQARRLKVGDEATISNFYWGNEIKATLKSIATDKENPQNKKTLTFDLEGSVTAGSELTVSVGQKSANYDLVVPNSSIRSDKNGKFVLVVEAKNSPLGNRYIAKRVKVDVLAEDDTNSAVSADLTVGDFVITTSSAPIKSGDQVRLADSQS
jgi:multidrug resistance efflux pump